jgi:hypothetical protein
LQKSKTGQFFEPLSAFSLPSADELSAFLKPEGFLKIFSPKKIGEKIGVLYLKTLLNSAKSGS